MAYVYRHIRLDINEPFYIGIGADVRGGYYRANSKHNRNKYWLNIANKTLYEVEILFDNLTWVEAGQKEIEFIALYGRKDLGTGCLVNMADGGGGVSGLSEESRKKLSDSLKGKVRTEEMRRNMSESHKGYKYSEERKRQLSERSKRIGISKETREKMAARLRGRPQPEWQRAILSKAAMGKKVTWSYVPVCQFSLSGELIGEYESISQAAKILGLQSANILKCIQEKRWHCGGYIFEYKKGDIGDIISKVKARVESNKANGLFVKQNRKIRNVSTGEMYNTLKECAASVGIPIGTIGYWLSKGQFDEFKYVFFNK